MKPYLAILLIFVTLQGCSSDESSIPDETPNNEVIDGGIINTYELVTIDIENITQDEYQATLGTVNTTVIKVNETKVAFQVPNTSNLGVQILSIPNLNGLQIQYDVRETDLSQSQGEVINTFQENLDQYIISIEGTPEYDYVDSYRQRVAEILGSLTIDETIALAKFYKANEPLFNSTFAIYTNRTALTDSNLQLLSKFSASALVFGLATAYVVIPPYEVTDILAAGLAIVSWSKAKDFYRRFAQRNLKIVSVVIDEILSFKGINNTITIQANETSTLPLASRQRPLSNEDSSDPNENITKFFDSNSTFNDVINSLNSAITYLNDNFFFSDLDVLQNTTLNTNVPIESTNSNELFFNNLNFSIESDNVEINQLSYNDGSIDLNVSFINPEEVENQLETTLTFTYSDDFNSTTGSFPITIQNELSILGDWTITGSDFCEVSDGSTFTDSGSGIITFNDDGTVIMDDDSNGNYLTNSYTFENNTIMITTSYRDYFDPECDGVNYQTVNNSFNLTLENDMTSFSGTTSSSVNTISGDACDRFGRTCNGNATIVR